MMMMTPPVRENDFIGVWNMNEQCGAKISISAHGNGVGFGHPLTNLELGVNAVVMPR